MACTPRAIKRDRNRVPPELPWLCHGCRKDLDDLRHRALRVGLDHVGLLPGERMPDDGEAEIRHATMVSLLAGRLDERFGNDRGRCHTPLF
jgi:hypothetical protein